MCNLSWGSVNKKLSLLESKGYINDVSGDKKHRQYRVTADGRELLEQYSGIQELVHIS